MRLLPAPFRDDLGRRVPVALVTRQVLRAVKADPARRPALRGLKREGDSLALVISFVLVGLLCGMPRLARWLDIPSGVEDGLALLIGSLLVVLSVRLLLPFVLGRAGSSRPEQTRRRFLAALLCPSCAHDLKGVPPRDDGVTVCPECGAAWRVEGVEARRHEGTEEKR